LVKKRLVFCIHLYRIAVKIVKNLTFWYSSQNRIFEKLNLELDAGHIYGLLEKNGAGKTTLLKLICGLSFPKSGTVIIDGLISAVPRFFFFCRPPQPRNFCAGCFTG